MSERKRILVYGFGNPGRLDDGLGPALAAELEDHALPGVTVDADYQLTVEDAAALRDYDLVLFVDAALTGPEPFSVNAITARVQELGFSSHSIDPAGVLSLARDLFGATPPSYLVAIRGYDFDGFGEQLSPRARQNLRATSEFLLDVLRRGDVAALAARCQASPAAPC